jgi:hypothetical protein
MESAPHPQDWSPKCFAMTSPANGSTISGLEKVCNLLDPLYSLQLPAPQMILTHGLLGERPTALILSTSSWTCPHIYPSMWGGGTWQSSPSSNQYGVLYTACTVQFYQTHAELYSTVQAYTAHTETRVSTSNNDKLLLLKVILMTCAVIRSEYEYLQLNISAWLRLIIHGCNVCTVGIRDDRLTASSGIMHPAWPKKSVRGAAERRERGRGGDGGRGGSGGRGRGRRSGGGGMEEMKGMELGEGGRASGFLILS